MIAAIYQSILLLFMWTAHVQSFYMTFNVSHANGPLKSITMDTVTGKLYIGGKNILLNLNKDFELMRELNMGPKQDNYKCAPYPEPCSEPKMLVDNDIEIVEINNKTDYLLVCGTVWQGLCSAHFLNDISASRSLSQTSVTSYIGSRTSSVAFFGEMNRNWKQTDDKLLYAAIGRDNRPPEFASAALSVREMNYTGTFSWNLNYFIDAPTYHTYIDVHNSLANTFKAYYIYGFEHELYTYFISVQMKDPTETSPQNNQFITKIIQICQNDVSFSSYSELPLQCTLDGSTTYHLATSASFAVEKTMDPIWDKKLFVTFGKNANFTPNPDVSQGSVLCVFTISSITEKFRQLHEDCFKNGAAYRVAWVYGNSLSDMTPCIRQPSVNLDKFCGGQPNVGIQDNPSLGTRHILTKHALYSVKNTILTSVSVVTQYGKTVAVFGTYDGYMLKVLVNGNYQKEAYMKYDLTKNRTVQVQRDMQLDKEEQNVFVLSGSQVAKFPLYSCAAHTTCETCVGSGDPLTCGWCGDHCSTRDLCIKPSTGTWSSDTCPPVITKIKPVAGPTSGHTYLTLQGRNFGSIQAQEVAVRINNGICKISERLHDKIVCTTPLMSDSGMYPVQLTVKDDSKTAVTYKIDGTFSYQEEQYAYKNPEIHNFSPTVGPRSGGSIITIYGKNFDIGTNKSVTLAYFPCAIISDKATELKCETTKWSSRRKRRDNSDSVAEGPLELRIDGGLYSSVNSFAYMEDSTVVNRSPERAIISGGITITVTGTNLDIIADPRIRMSFTKNFYKSVNESCVAKSDSKMMNCPAPNITGLLDNSHKGKEILTLYMSFVMDGIEDLRKLPEIKPWLGTFKYHPDPQFYSFTESDSIKYFDLAEKLLEIKGSKMTLGITKDDITVMIGKARCNVTKLKESIMSCQPIDKPSGVGSNEPKRAVQVRVGNLVFNIGYLVYVEAKTSVSVATIVIGAIVAIVVIGIIGLVLVMWKTKFGPFKDKSAHGYGAQYSAGREVAFEGLDSAGQRIFDMQNRENAYAEQRLSESGANGAAGGAPLITLDDDLLLVLQDKNLLIERDWLAMGEIIGRGHFGCVYKGFITFPDIKGDTLVAVKTLHQNNPREIDIKAFIDEALRMKDFSHDNVLTLTGICFGIDDMPLVILPFMSHGDLLSYIRNDSNNPTIKDLIMFGIDISKGMEYLSGLKFVHRDLAARNCMLDDDYRVKVADFGLSRDIYERDYYSSDNKKSKLPVKWMAPESLEKGNYNSKSDVWSFGVVLWELMTRGVNPYPEVDNWDVLRYIKSGRRMPQPPYCPDTLYVIMTKCWSFNPNERPTFSVLVHEIKDMITILQQQMKQGKETSDIQNTYVNVELCTDYHYADSPPVVPGDGASSPPTSPTEVTPIVVTNSKQKEPQASPVTQTDV